MSEFDLKKQKVENQINAEKVCIGVPFEQYKKDLDEKQQKIETLIFELGKTAYTDKKRKELEIQLAEIENERQNEQASYEKFIQQLKEKIQRLDQLIQQVPDQLIEQAKAALQVGDNTKAKQLLTQLETQAEPHILAAAEAAYQCGLLEKEAVSYILNNLTLYHNQWRIHGVFDKNMKSQGIVKAEQLSNKDPDSFIEFFLFTAIKRDIDSSSLLKLIKFYNDGVSSLNKKPLKTFDMRILNEICQNEEAQ